MTLLMDTRTQGSNNNTAGVCFGDALRTYCTRTRIRSGKQTEEKDLFLKFGFERRRRLVVLPTGIRICVSGIVHE